MANDGFTDFLANLGFGTSNSQKNAQGDLGDAKDAYKNLNVPDFKSVDLKGPVEAPDSVVQQQGPSNMGGISTDPAYRQAQMQQMAALQNLAAKGGRSASSDANLAAIEQRENANAKGQMGAIMQNAQARGMGSSGNALLAKMQASGDAIARQNAQDTQVAGQQQQAALQAGMGAAQLGSGLESQDFGEQATKAQAQDSIDRFNAGQGTQNSQFNVGKTQGVNNQAAAAGNQGQIMNNYQMPQAQFGDAAQKAGGIAGADEAGTKYWQTKAGTDAATTGGLLSGGMEAGGKVLGGLATVGAFAAHGGKVPGTPRVPGDSLMNDTKLMATSPGEVIVPRTLAQTGNKDQIAGFVKSAPPTTAPDHQREAMLSALKNLANRRKSL